MSVLPENRVYNGAEVDRGRPPREFRRPRDRIGYRKQRQRYAHQDVRFQTAPPCYAVPWSTHLSATPPRSFWLVGPVLPGLPMRRRTKVRSTMLRTISSRRGQRQSTACPQPRARDRQDLEPSMLESSPRRRLTPYPRKCTSSGSTLLACVQFKPCGAPSIVINLLPSTISAVRLADTGRGTMRSASPWMINVGTSTRVRSCRKSVEENAVTQSSVPFGEAPAAMFQQSCTTWSLTSVPPNWSTLKKFARNWDKNARRSARTPALIPSNAAPSTPSGLSAVFSRNGGTADMNTARLTSSDPYLPKYRATSPPPIEKPTRAKSCRSSAVTSLWRSSVKVS